MLFRCLEGPERASDIQQWICVFPEGTGDDLSEEHRMGRTANRFHHLALQMAQSVLKNRAAGHAVRPDIILEAGLPARAGITGEPAAQRFVVDRQDVHAECHVLDDFFVGARPVIDADEKLWRAIAQRADGRRGQSIPPALVAGRDDVHGGGHMPHESPEAVRFDGSGCHEYRLKSLLQYRKKDQVSYSTWL